MNLNCKTACKLWQKCQKDRNKIIDDIIAEVVKQEQLEREQAQQDQINSMIFDQQRGNAMNRVNAPSGGGWYFYNPAQLSFGKNEFTKKWEIEKMKTIGEEEINLLWTLPTTKMMKNWLMVKNLKSNRQIIRVENTIYKIFHLQNSAMSMSHELIQEALLNMGRVYKDRFHDYVKAIEAL